MQVLNIYKFGIQLGIINSNIVFYCYVQPLCYICMYVELTFENLLMGELSLCTISHLFIYVNINMYIYIHRCVFRCAILLCSVPVYKYIRMCPHMLI